MADCCRRALTGPPEPAPSLPFNPFADFREHSPPKQLEAREEPVVRHASEVHLQMPTGFAQDDASTVARTSRSCPGMSRDRLSRAQHKQTEAQSTACSPRLHRPERLLAGGSIRSWMVSSRAASPYGSQASAGDSRLPEKPSEDTAGTFTSRRARSLSLSDPRVRVPPRRLDTRRHRRRYAPSHRRPRGLYSRAPVDDHVTFRGLITIAGNLIKSRP